MEKKFQKTGLLQPALILTMQAATVVLGSQQIPATQGSQKETRLTLVVEPGCITDVVSKDTPKLLVNLPPPSTYTTFRCREDYRGKRVSFDPQTGRPIVVTVSVPTANVAGAKGGYIPHVPPKEKFINIGLVARRIELLPVLPTPDKRIVGYRYQPANGELSRRSIYFVVRDETEPNSPFFVIGVYRTLDFPWDPNPKKRPFWAEIWTMRQERSEHKERGIALGEKTIRIFVLPDGNIELHVAGQTPLVLPMGKRALP